MKFTMISIAVFALVICALPSGTAQAGTMYRVVEIGPLDTATGINDLGQVVGYTYSGQGFVYRNGTFSYLGTLPGGQLLTPQAINNNGQIVGYGAEMGASGDYAFSYQNGVLTDLGDLADHTIGSFGHAVNDSGVIVGNAGVTNSSGLHAFVYSNGIMTDLGTLPGGIGSQALGINNLGQIVGVSSTGDSSGYNRAVLFSGGVLTELSDGNASFAAAINDAGQIIGGVPTTNHAVLWNNGIMTDLGSLPGFLYSGAFSINQQGQIVGQCVTSDNSQYAAVIWDDGTVLNLDQQLDASGAGWTLTRAEAINDNGWIVGQGVAPGGENAAFLLIPVPEPTGLALSLIAAASLLGAGLHRRIQAVGEGSGEP